MNKSEKPNQAVDNSAVDLFLSTALFLDSDGSFAAAPSGVKAGFKRNQSAGKKKGAYGSPLLIAQ
jgi:hypothetical protein